ncbi:hypothetical protein TorRG33x02_323730, partial [Trema orientale]
GLELARRGPRPAPRPLGQGPGLPRRGLRPAPGRWAWASASVRGPVASSPSRALLGLGPVLPGMAQVNGLAAFSARPFHVPEGARVPRAPPFVDRTDMIRPPSYSSNHFRHDDMPRYFQLCRYSGE